MLAGDGSRDVYVGGDFTNYNSTPSNRLIRLHSDGAVARSCKQGFDNTVLALALPRTGGGLYVLGSFNRFEGQPAPGVVRLTHSGARDPGFHIEAGLDFSPSTVAVTEDGSGDLYVGGNISGDIPGTIADLVIGRIVRLNQDGSPDTTFPMGAQFPGIPDEISPVISSLASAPESGKLYVGGNLLTYNGKPSSSLTRLNPDGTVDPTFMSRVGPIPGSTAVETIQVVDSTRDVYAGGRIFSPGAFGSIRVKETGAPDTTYVPTVELITFAMAPAEDGTGDVFVSGFFSPENRIRLLRLTHDGAVVSTFNEPKIDGEVLTIVPVPDGTKDIYIGGIFTTYNGQVVNRIARIHANGIVASVVTSKP